MTAESRVKTEGTMDRAVFMIFKVIVKGRVKTECTTSSAVPINKVSCQGASVLRGHYVIAYVCLLCVLSCFFRTNFVREGGGR